MGTLEESNGVKRVKDDFYLATAADIVADPSAPDAFVRGIMESREWININGLWMEQDIDRAKALIKRTPSKNLDEAKLNIFKSFIEKL